MVSSASLPSYEASSMVTNGSKASLNAGTPTLATMPIKASSSQQSTGDFYFRTLLRYVRSGNTENYAEKLEFILKQCPSLASSKSSTTGSGSPILINGSGSGANVSTTGSSSSHHHHHHHHNLSIKLNERSRSALVALLLLMIENFHENSTGANPTQLNPELLNYLLTVLENLPNARWIDDQAKSTSWVIICFLLVF
jgi:hypothetical protein